MKTSPVAAGALALVILFGGMAPATAAAPVITTGHNIDLNVRERICNWFPFWC